MSVKSYNTAISRKGPSSPLIRLEKLDKLHGSILDYGCGRGADAEYLLSKSFETESYDPHWKPESLGDNKYDTVLCTYVFNVVQEGEQSGLIKKLLDRLHPDGKAYISVRRDIKKEGETSRGFQRNVFLSLPVVKELKSNYCIYELTHSDCNV